MTATPIPRSLALTLYGDLDTSYLRERPGGRDLATHVTHARSCTARRARRRLRARARGRCAAGRQAYVVCALVDESDDAEAKAATRRGRAPARRRSSRTCASGLLTGQMKPAEKAAAMEAFRAGEIDVLVATTVIEVGVDVPNATVMIVEDAERFGLAQLHQLRGRVGRGEHPGDVPALRRPEDRRGPRSGWRRSSPPTDGFALAEEDLRLRGEGQVLGERQHGLPELRLASVLARRRAARRGARGRARDRRRATRTSARPSTGRCCARCGGGSREAWEWVSSG